MTDGMWKSVNKGVAASSKRQKKTHIKHNLRLSPDVDKD